MPCCFASLLFRSEKAAPGVQEQLQAMLMTGGLAQGPRNIIACISQSSLRHAIKELTMIMPGDQHIEEERALWPLAQVKGALGAPGKGTVGGSQRCAYPLARSPKGHNKALRLVQTAACVDYLLLIN